MHHNATLTTSLPNIRCSCGARHLLSDRSDRSDPFTACQQIMKCNTSNCSKAHPRFWLGFGFEFAKGELQCSNDEPACTIGRTFVRSLMELNTISFQRICQSSISLANAWSIKIGACDVGCKNKRSCMQGPAEWTSGDG